jgi:hypothetical protein
MEKFLVLEAGTDIANKSISVKISIGGDKARGVGWTLVSREA